MAEEENKEVEETKEVEVKEEPKKSRKKKPDVKAGAGVDVGTSNIVVARQTEEGTFINRFHRDMLYELDVSDEAADLLENSSYLYVKVGNKYYVVGEDALNLVNAIGKGEVIRPMQDGILNPNIKESSELLFYIIKAVVGDPIEEGECLRFSVPANPVDSDLDNLFHEMILKGFFERLGYDAKSVNEAMCITYDCNPIMTTDEGEIPFSGISVSCGGGMWNISLSFKGMGLLEFSCTKSGDHLDEQVSRVTGIPKSKVIKAKEKGLDLDNIDNSDRVQAALSIYYDEMVNRMIHHISENFAEKKSEMDGEIEVVVAGGTSMPKGFCNRLEKAIEKSDFPFKVKGVRHSETPFYSVSQGACIRAQADQKKKKSK
jgi:actin-like ATPase involved in cell morphogenesis